MAHEDENQLKIGRLRLTPDEAEEARWGLLPETDKGPDDIPVMVYDINDQVLWQTEAANGGFKHRTIYTILGVNGEPTPIRWLAHLAETARLIEGLQERGIDHPANWKMVAPINLNAAVNNGNAELARRKADKLAKLAGSYVQKFHPTVPFPDLEIDNHGAVDETLESGKKIDRRLPTHIREQLTKMARKHEKGTSAAHASVGYLLGHADFYGLRHSGLFPKRENGLFVLPGSEGNIFLPMLEDVLPYMESQGMDITRPEAAAHIRTVSKTIGRPHYYPLDNGQGQTEFILENLQHTGQWPTVNQYARSNFNGLVVSEIRDSLSLIENDIGGKSQIPKLVQLVQETMNS